MADIDEPTREEPVEHGLELGCYSNGPSGLLPHIRCLCGWFTKYGSADNWEEAGALLDEHLSEVDRG